MTAALFSPLKINGVSFKNRIGMSPMCQYSSKDGVARDWHMVHLGARAVGGVGFIMAECTAVSSTGRISQGCAGLWNAAQVAALKPIVAFQQQFGTVTGIQISHSGRKGSAATALDGGSHLDAGDPDGWETVGPTSDAFDPDGTRLWKAPRALSVDEIQKIQDQFVHSAKLALEVGYDLLEVHCAHGYLLHSFLTPLVNTRDDAYGGDLRARARFLLETVEKVRAVWPEEKVLSVRLSVDDFATRGLTLDDAAQADGLIRSSKADIVLLGREMMRDPHWAFTAAKKLGVDTRHVLAEQYGFFVGAS